MRNLFSKKKNIPVITNSSSTNTITVTGSIVPTQTIHMGIGVMGIQGVSGHQGTSGTCGIGTTTLWGSSGRSYLTEEQRLEERKKQLTDEFERNPELFSDIIVELRRRKINKIKTNLV